MSPRVAATLAGRRVAVTRAPDQARELVDLLRSRGAEPVACATIDFAAPLDGYAALDEVVRSIDRYGWVAFTSQNAVAAFADRATALGVALPATTRLAAVGGVTARVASERLRPVDFVPSSAQAESLATQMEDVVKRRVLFPRGDLAGDTLGRLLRSRGATVDEVVAYRTIPGSGTRELAEMVRGGDVDAIIFMSASSVRHLVDALDPGGAARLAARTPAVICIGPETARAARDAGVEVSAVAIDRTASGVVDALEGWFGRQGERDDGKGI